MCIRDSLLGMLRLRQRWLHYFFVNEFTTLAVLFWLSTTPLCTSLSPGYKLLFIMSGIAALHLGIFALIGCIAVVRRYFRPSYKHLSSEPCFDLGNCPGLPEAPAYTCFDHPARDGVKLRVHLAKGKKGCPVMLFAAPLGQCGPSIYSPIRARFGDGFTYVSWDYRGLFASGCPGQSRRISIHEHAEDAIEVLNACGFGKCDVMVGHSMGTAVAFETCLLFPQKVSSLIILNGFHGHVFHTAFQPICRFAFVADGVGKFVGLLIDYPWVLFDFVSSASEDFIIYAADVRKYVWIQVDAAGARRQLSPRLYEGLHWTSAGIRDQHE
eukprot:TRINITY_DN17632_c0_g1_i1.p1 TRINITY_DN17632_c0_g1~~TRINITY_DN17632_c0_g1_i1.p1  ORF type:complete len:325 (-),score=60.53 TRINITY_DN17632_c0_g1_i1:614-1588(-)